MASKNDLIDEIVSNVRNVNQSRIVSPLQIGKGEWENELLLFIKPEIFMVEKDSNVRASVELVFEKLEEYDANIDGIMILGGPLLDEKKIMDRHYGFINRLSRTASRILSPEDLQVIARNLDLPSLDGFDVLGGHEYLEKYPNETAGDLDNLWFQKKSIKLRSGFYFHGYQKNNKDLLLINGFHPAQLLHFTDPTHRIVLFLIHSNTAWKVLKNEMVGATFPEKAIFNSIRGQLYAEPSKYGLETVSIANNGVHLSAGPFEAAYEIRNFFGGTLDIDWNTVTPTLIARILSKGVERKAAFSALDNPQINLGTESVDLFTATEDTDTGKAIDLWIKGNNDPVILLRR